MLTPARVTVVGLGKLGSPLLTVLAASGFDVCGVDINADTVAKIQAGIAPVQEPRLQELMTLHRSRIHATLDWHDAVSHSDVTYLLVPTPSGVDGGFRNDYVLSALETVGEVLRRKSDYHLVVVNSTVMPGSIDGPIRDRLEAASGKRVGPDIGLCYNPEFIALGNVVEGLLHPDFVLIGESDAEAGVILEAVSRRVVGDQVPIARMNAVNAELTKIAVNTFVTTKISFANMLSEICENMPGADADVVTAALGRDTRIGRKYLRGATGYGGPCFPRDTIAFARMAQQVGIEANLATATHAINERQINRVRSIVAELTDSTDCVAVLGLAYKPDTAVIEQSQGLMLASAIAQMGRRVIVHDPLAIDAARSALGTGIEFAVSAEAAVAMATAVVLMTPCGEYQSFFADWRAPTSLRLVIDCWRLVDHRVGTDELRIVHLGRNDTFAAS